LVDQFGAAFGDTGDDLAGSGIVDGKAFTGKTVDEAAIDEGSVRTRQEGSGGRADRRHNSLVHAILLDVDEHSAGRVMERIGRLQAKGGASARSVKTKFPLGQDASRLAGQDQDRIESRILRESP
jgi:hypothetical protein